LHGDIEMKRSCRECLKQKEQIEFYSKGLRYDSICKECRSEKRKNQYRKASLLVAKSNLESMHTNVTIINGNDWLSLVFTILKSNFLESNNPQTFEDIKINNKLNGITQE
jgi:hypothetical protein